MQEEKPYMTVTEKGSVSHGSIYVPKPVAALAAWCEFKHIKHLRHERKNTFNLVSHLRP